MQSAIQFFIQIAVILGFCQVVGGKGVACWLAARATGLSNREALGIGTLKSPESAG